MTSRFAYTAAAALLAGACHVGADAERRDPGPEVSRNYQVGAFDKIAVAGPYEVNVVTRADRAESVPRRVEPARRDRCGGRGRNAEDHAQEA